MAVFKRRWFMWDFARQRSFDRKEFSMVATKLSELGFNGIGLYLEGAFELKSIGGGILRDGVMTREDAVWVKELCKSLGIKVFPMTNVVGHMEHFLRQERFRHLCPDESLYKLDFKRPEAEEFALKIVYDYVEAFDTDYIHIGGDEVPLTEESRPVYAKFLSNICDKLLADGITPGIWNDMLWHHKELCEPFDRKVEIFDWWYNGHRPESIKFFREQGVDIVIPCASDNSWNGFTSHQMIRPWNPHENQTPVTPDEIEAFLSDIIVEGDADNLMGLHTHWEDTMGRDLWGQWTVFARSGLFMAGKYDKETCNDEMLEKAIFGRVTPYTEIMHVIQNEIHTLWAHPCHGILYREFMFGKNAYTNIIKNISREKPDVAVKAEAAVAKIEALLETWTAEGEFEERCRAYLVSIAALIKADFAVYGAFEAKNIYREAANMQFTDNQKAKELTLKFAEGFSHAAELTKEYIPTLRAFVDLVPTHTATDFIKLERNLKYTENMADIIKEFALSDSFERIPLPALECVVDKALNGNVIER